MIVGVHVWGCVITVITLSLAIFQCPMGAVSRGPPPTHTHTPPPPTPTHTHTHPYTHTHTHTHTPTATLPHTQSQLPLTLLIEYSQFLPLTVNKVLMQCKVLT